MDWKNVSYVLSSKQRAQILTLLETPRTPTQLAKLTKISLANIWIKLKGLEQNKLILCLTPKVKKGKIYVLSNLGKEALTVVKQMET